MVRVYRSTAVHREGRDNDIGLAVVAHTQRRAGKAAPPDAAAMSARPKQSKIRSKRKQKDPLDELQESFANYDTEVCVCCLRCNDKCA